MDDGGLVLVAEHDPGVAQLARLYLTREGFAVRVETEPAVAAVSAALRRLDLDASSGLLRNRPLSPAAGQVPAP
ncbi:MAG: DNA-binding response regulator, OmpR family, contains and winged-helix domain [Streptosporangiaceae bacterium]|jgi:hypothetical protein|nr:DNA-binding response regulator, OmpR family, contains and winged-helix domain [Streptosporangiaceae bacterium]